MSETQKFEKNILLIDNSILIIERLIIILNELIEVSKIFKATDYSESVEILKLHKINVVLLDIQLPVKNGFELLKYIVDNYPDIKVVIISNLASMYYQKRCKAMGAAAYIDKSTDFDQIPGLVSTL